MKFRPRFPSGVLALELLEHRQMLSVAPAPGMVAPIELGSYGAARDASPQSRITVTPGDRAVLAASDAPTAIVADLEPAAIRYWSNGGIALYKVGTEGALTAVFDPEQPPEAVVDRLTNTAAIPLGGALEPGRYRVVLVGGADSFSRKICDGSWDYMEDQTLAEFEVVEEGGGFGSAVDAGAVGPAVESFAGSLTARGERAFYKFALGADQPLWRLGLQLDAERIGSALQATLTVYDDQGNVVATSEGTRGLATAPNDPHLFVGLRPGTYYVGVSAAEGSRTSGAYHLTMVADPAAEPTRVTGFALDWTQGAPTGFTITFSDAISPDALGVGGAPLLAIDERGVAHPAFLSGAEDGLRRLSFVFDQSIPAGRYQLVAPSAGGLVDLIGRAPVADGQSSGLLATWTVSAYRPGLDPNRPAKAGQHGLDAAHCESLIDNAVGPGGALSLRFGVGTGTTGTANPGAVGAQRGTTEAGHPGTVAGVSPTFIGVLDSGLVGRPAARSDGIANVGPIPPEGRLLLANVARERLSGHAPAPSAADDGLARSPNGMLELVGPESALSPSPSPVVEPGAPRLVEFPRGRPAESVDDGAQADAEALERLENDRLAAATAGLVRWLFGSPVQHGDDHPDPELADARLLAQIDAKEPPPDDGSADDHPEGGVTRAGLGVPLGVIIGVAVAYRLHRRPPRWWRRRRPIEKVADARPFTAAPRGPRYMVPPSPVVRRGVASRKVVHR